MTPLAPPFGHPRSGRKGFVPRLPILGTIANLTATASDGEVILTFTAPVGAHGYLPQYRTTAGPGAWADAGNPEDPAPYPPGGFTVDGLTNDTAYDFRVIANDDFNSTTSNVDSATPTSTAGFGTVNDLAVEATQTDTTLDFDFTQVSDDLGNPAKYAIRIRTPTLDSNSWGEAFDTEIFIDSNLAIGVTKSVQFTGLTAGTDYEALLIPFRGPNGNADTFGDFSNSAAGTTTGTSSLGTISDLVAQPGDTQVALTWSPAANATSHQPQYKLDSEPTVWTNFGSPLGASASSVTVTGLTNDSPYDFRVQAGDGVTTTDSNVETVTPVAASNNEPAGMTQLVTTNDFQDGNLPGASGWTFNDVLNPAFATIETDGNSPGDDSNVMRITYPDGMSGGGSTDHVRNTSLFPSTTKTLYISLRLKLSANFQGHPSGSGSKLFFFANGEGGSITGGVFAMLRGEGATNPLRLVIQNQSQVSLGGGVRNFEYYNGDNEVSPSGADATVTRNVWHHIEIVGQQGPNNGDQNGSMEVWLNGTKILSFNTDHSVSDSDFDFFNPNKGTESWRGFKSSAIWGGTGGVVDGPMWIDWDKIYISGKN